MVISTTAWDVPDEAKKKRPTNAAAIPTTKTCEVFLIDLTPLKFFVVYTKPTAGFLPSLMDDFEKLLRFFYTRYLAIELRRKVHPAFDKFGATLGELSSYEEKIIF